MADLRVDIDPTWGIQKIFHRYREALERFALKTASTTSEIARFRQANATTEVRLRMSLPERMARIDARYAGDDGEGGPSLSAPPLLIEYHPHKSAPPT
jgi:hypothetical protein